MTRWYGVLPVFVRQRQSPVEKELPPGHRRNMHGLTPKAEPDSHHYRATPGQDRSTMIDTWPTCFPATPPCPIITPACTRRAAHPAASRGWVPGRWITRNMPAGWQSADHLQTSLPSRHIGISAFMAMQGRSKPAASGPMRLPQDPWPRPCGLPSGVPAHRAPACCCMPACHGVCSSGYGCMACEIR